MNDVTTGVRFLADHIAARMLDASVFGRIAIALVATMLALFIGVVIIAASGYDAVRFVSSLVYDAVENVSNLAFMFRQSSMLILTGVTVAVALRASMFNIGVQGQFIVSGFAAILGILFAAPPPPNPSVSAIPLLTPAMLLALATSGAHGALPGVMKVYAGVNEVITTIMLGFIVSDVVYFLFDACLHPEGAAAPDTEQFPDYVGPSGFVFESPSSSTFGLDAALLTVVVIYLVTDRTGFGYNLIMNDYQGPAARYSSVDPKRIVVRMMTIPGMIVGSAGVLFAIMVLGHCSDPNTFPTFGLDAVAMSLLTTNNPLGAVPAGPLFGSLDAGSQYIGSMLGVPGELVGDIIGPIVLFVVALEPFHATGQRTSFGDDRE